jgi:hypothetical protein
MSAKNARTTDAFSIVELPVEAETPVEWTWPCEEWTALPSAPVREPTVRLIAPPPASSDAPFHAALRAADRLRDLAAVGADASRLVAETDGNAAATVAAEARESIDDGNEADRQITDGGDVPEAQRLPGSTYLAVIEKSSPDLETQASTAATIAGHTRQSVDDDDRLDVLFRRAGDAPDGWRRTGEEHRGTVVPVKGRRHPIAHFITAASIGVAATLAWQAYGDGAKRLMVTYIVPQLGWSSLAAAMSQPSGVPSIAPERVGPGAAQIVAPEAAPVEAAAVNTRAASENASAATRSAEVQQLETMARDLAAMRQRIDELAANQARMSRQLHPKEP